METAAGHLNWARALDYVLSDRPALDAFREWLVENASAEYLDLYFALRAYERMSVEHNPKTLDLAKSIYSKYISLRTGLCDSLPGRFRQMIGERVKSMTSSVQCDPHLFAQCSVLVEDSLRRQHQLFVSSDEFINAFNKMSMMENNYNTLERRHHQSWRRNASHNATMLTAEALLRSRHDRQTTLGETKLEKMYPPASARQPYVCNATTSQNDSAVSSSFSSDAAGNRASRLRHIKEEHLRGNAASLFVPRVENAKPEGTQYDHSTDEGRKYFAHILTKKLIRQIEKIKRNDETERQINDIEQCKYTTLDVVSTTDAGDIKFDDDEDLDDYVSKMRDDSLRASANRSPPVQCNASRTFSPSRDLPQPDIVQMSSSTYSRTSKSNSFAPPPQFAASDTGQRTKERSRSNVYDSSGFCSMAPSSAFSDSRKLPTGRSRPSTSSSTARRFKKQGVSSQLITISYKGFDGVPIVAHVPQEASMTLREFRRYFSISSPNYAQFFFKSDCEDGSAPYQLLLVSDDSQILPIYQGKITAELKKKLPE